MEILLLFGNIAYSGLLINCSYCFFYPDHAITPCPTAKHITCFIYLLLLYLIVMSRTRFRVILHSLLPEYQKTPCSRQSRYMMFK